MSTDPEITVHDTPINRASIDQLPIEALDKWLAVVRTRRLLIVQQLQAVREAKRVAHASSVAEKFTKQYERTKVQLGKLDELIAKVEVSVNKLRALRLEIDDDVPINEGV